MNGQLENAVAGPSNPRSNDPQSSALSPSSSAAPHLPPLLFLPPSGPPQPPAYLASTQDLLSRFHLLSAYDKYVRPYSAPTDTDQVPPTPITPSGFDKGKGREVVVEASPANPQTPGGPDADDDDGPGGKGDKKKKNNYKHLIKGVPGKHSMKKDDYLATMMQVPPKQRINIIPFDLRTQREAFTVSLEGLKGWNPSALVLESAQAREDRKKRKELKRLAKAQAHAPQPAIAHTPAAHQPQIIQAPIPTSVTSVRPQIAETPRTSTGTPRPGSTVPRPGSAVPRPGSAVPRPTSTIQRPGSTVPRPGSTNSSGAKPALPPVQVPSARAGTPVRLATPTSAHPGNGTSGAGIGAGGIQRGKKRERDDIGNGSGTGYNGTGAMVNGIGGGMGNGNNHGNGVGLNSATNNTPKAIINAKAGVVGARPRPIKKQRMDAQGQARDVTAAPVQQQPTPQGV